jgi:hypothetical protein
VRRILVIVAVAAVAVAAVLLLRGGGGSASDVRQVRLTLAGYALASSQKDYTTICKRYLAPTLLNKMRQIRIPCRVALKRGLGRVVMPTLVVGSVKVTGTTALADVHTGAANQKPLDGTIELIKIAGMWRLLSQAETAPAAH